VRTGWNAGGALFSALKDPVYNGNEEVAFIATLKAGTGDATSANNTGVWSNTGGPLHLVAREGFQAPGCAAGTNFREFHADRVARSGWRGAARQAHAGHGRRDHGE